MKRRYPCQLTSLTKHARVTQKTTSAGAPRGGHLVAEELEQQALTRGEYRSRRGCSLVERDVRQEVGAQRVAVASAKVLPRAWELRLLQVQSNYVVRFCLRKSGKRLSVVDC